MTHPMYHFVFGTQEFHSRFPDYLDHLQSLEKLEMQLWRSVKFENEKYNMLALQIFRVEELSSFSFLKPLVNKTKI